MDSDFPTAPDEATIVAEEVVESDPAADLALVEHLEAELARIESELHALDDVH